MTVIRYAVPILVLALVAGGALVYWPRARVAQAGPARVVDAGTLEIAGTPHRLAGIISPRPDQHCVGREYQDWACGQQAVQALRQLVTGTSVACRPGPGAGARSECFVGGQSLSELLVRQGWALACRSGASDYSAEERNARFLMLGLWRGGFDPSVAPDSCSG